MIRLGLKREPYWLDLPGLALRLQVRPMSEALMSQTRSAAETVVVALVDSHRAIVAAGGTITGVPDFTLAEVRQGVVEAEFTKALGVAAILDWTGVTGEDGTTKAEVNPDTITELMAIYPVGSRFRNAYLASEDALHAEKNASRPALTGTAAAGPDIAADAGTSAPPAAGASEGSTTNSAPTPGTVH